MGLPVEGAVAGAVVVGTLVVLAALPLLASEYVVGNVAFRILEYAALAQAWNLLAGYGGLISLGTAAFVGIGMYGTAKLVISAGMPVVPAMVTGGAMAALFAALVSPALFRLRGLYFVIATLVLAQALGIWMVNWNGLGGSLGLFLTNTAPSAEERYYTALVIAAATTALVAGLLRTRLGLSLRAVRDNEDAAQQLGLSTFHTKLWAFLVSAFVMGVVGGMQANWQGKIEPYGAFSLNWTVDVVTIAIIGGMGTVVGPLLGSVLVIYLGERLADYPEIHVAITGAILILVIRFAPYGVWGALLQLARAARRRRGVRRGGWA